MQIIPRFFLCVLSLLCLSLLVRADIFDAVRAGNLADAENILREHPEQANARDKCCWTPLHIAAFNGDAAMTKLLISKGADVNARYSIGIVIAERGNPFIEKNTDNFFERYTIDIGNRQYIVINSYIGGDSGNDSKKSGWLSLNEDLYQNVGSVYSREALRDNIRDTVVGRKKDLPIYLCNNVTPISIAIARSNDEVCDYLFDAHADILSNISQIIPTHIYLIHQFEVADPPTFTGGGGNMINGSYAPIEKHYHSHLDFTTKDELIGYSYTPCEKIAFTKLGRKVAFHAIDTDDLNILKQMSFSLSLNQQDAHGDTSLHYALQLNKLPIAEKLVDWGAATTIKNVAGETPLDYAKKFGYTDFVTYCNKHSFELAIYNRDSQSIKHMCANGFDIRKTEPNVWHCLISFARDNPNDPQKDVILTLIDCGADINGDESFVPTLYALDTHDKELLGQLLKRGANRDGLYKLLKVALEKDDKLRVDCLLDSGLSINTTVDGIVLADLQKSTDKTKVLMNAISTGDAQKVETLLKEGVSPNIHTPSGDTILRYAFDEKQAEIAILLINHGADVRSEHYISVLYFTNKFSENNLCEIAKTLFDHGTTINVGEPFTLLELALGDKDNLFNLYISHGLADNIDEDGQKRLLNLLIDDY